MLNTHRTRRLMLWMTGVLGVLSAGIVTYGFVGGNAQDGEMLQGMLLPQNRQTVPWATISAADVESGSTILANTNTIVKIPEGIKQITRRTLLGHGGDTIRYWGYCFPPNYEKAKKTTKVGFPGELFLSEAERAVRANKLETEKRRKFSVFKNLTLNDLNETASKPASMIRNQIEIIPGGTSCYVMTEKQLPVGIDRDDDGLNSALERSFGTSDLNADTDGDGISDSIEVFSNRTSPTKRDSDGDGIIDGLEDANRNGRFDIGETNPSEWDSDRDGLCDGLCKVNNGKQLEGEDKNLNGIYEPDQNEYNPRTEDSDRDNVLDGQEVYLCRLGGGSDC